MKRILAIILACSSLVFAGCSNEVDSNLPEESRMTTVYFDAEMQEYATKTNINVDNTDRRFLTTWASADDKIGVRFVNDSQYATSNRFNELGTYSPSEGKFAVNMTEENADYVGAWDYWAYYPYSENEDVYSNAALIPFGDTRTQVGNKAASEYDILYGEAHYKNVKPGYKSATETMAFEMDRATALLYFHLSNSEITETITSATLEVVGSPIASKDNVSLCYASKTASENGVLTPSEGSTKITVTFTDAPTADDFKLWFNILPGTFSKLTLTVETETKKFELVNNNSSTYSKGNIYRIAGDVTALWDDKGEGGENVKIVFKSGSLETSDSSSAYTVSSSLTDVFSEGANFISAITTTNNVYAARTSVGGAKFGSSKAAGEITFTLKKAVFASKIIVTAAPYSDTEGKSGLLVNGNVVDMSAGTKLSLSDYDIELGEEVSSITITHTSGSRVFVNAITLLAESGPVVTKYNVNCATVEGGTISASSDKAAEGATVTLTATPATGYEFESWNVTGATVVDASSATTTFTMPAANVNVSATFKEKRIPTFASLAELVAADLASGTEVTVSFENVPIKEIYVTNGGYRNGIYFDIQKGGKDIEIYYQNVPKAWVEGGTVSGTLTKCPWKLYNGTWELAPASDWSWSNLEYTAPVVLAAPAITTQPTNATYVLNQSSKNLTVVASGNPNPTYQWYSNTTNSNENGTILTGETSTSYKPSTNAVGTFYYYCIATNSEGSATSNVATITVNEPATANLPFSFDGGKSDIARTNGMSQTGLGDDYSSSPKLKFDSAGDNVIVNFNEAAKKVTYTIKGNSTSGTYAFDVMESADGIEYTAVHSHSSITDVTTYTDNLAPSSRFVKFVYTTKASGNVALGNISISNKATYTLTINAAENGKITAKVDGQAVVSGAQIEEGKTVTITASPDTNYEFDTWNVTGATVGTTATETFTMNGDVTVGATFREKPGEKTFSTTYGYGLSDWTLTNYTKQSDYYQVPSGNDPSVATIAGIFAGKTLTTDVVITINCATYGSGTNPSKSTFSIYKETACTNAITATQGGTLPTSSTYTNVTYTVSQADAASFANDLAVKITKPGKTIRLKSIKVEFKYTNN